MSLGEKGFLYSVEFAVTEHGVDLDVALSSSNQGADDAMHPISGFSSHFEFCWTGSTPRTNGMFRTTSDMVAYLYAY